MFNTILLGGGLLVVEGWVAVVAKIILGNFYTIALWLLGCYYRVLPGCCYAVAMVYWVVVSG